MKLSSFCFSLSSLLALIFLAGCGASSPPLAPVTGTVSHQGRTLHTGMIVFTPDSAKGGRGPIAKAKIQEDGSFTLYTGDSAGAVPGWHRVTIVALGDPGMSTSEQRFAVPISLIPIKYRNADTSGLTRQVKAEKNVFHLKLE